jgi:homoserine O-acetyltransferase
MSAAVTLPKAATLCPLPAEWPLFRGGVLRGGWLAYTVTGPACAPALAVLGGISAGRLVAADPETGAKGWWTEQVGPGRPLDTTRWRVVGIDWLGGAGLSSAPRAGEKFPTVDTRDQAAALACLLDALAIDRLAALVGCSYGGMVGLQFAAMHPGRLARLLVLGAAHRSTAAATAGRAVQRGIVELGVRAGDPAAGVALARGLALLGYRTPEGLEQRFGAATTADTSPGLASVADWLAARGQSFAAAWSAESYQCLLASLDRHQVEPRAITVPTWLGSLAGDRLVPLELMAELAAALPQCRSHRELATQHGHDGFLRSPAAVGAWLTEVLS